MIHADASILAHYPRMACGRAIREPDGRLIAGIAPDQWLIIDRPETDDLPLLLESANGEPGLFTVVDVTHARVLLRLTGPDSAKMMAKLCAVDLSERSTLNGASLRTSVARVVADVIRDDLPAGANEGLDIMPSYLIGCDRSVGRYLFEAILDAGAEFGIDVEGFAAR